MQRSLEKIVLWGTGICAHKIMTYIKEFQDIATIVAVFDNNCEQWKKIFDGYIVHSPGQLLTLEYDKIVISSEIFFEEIKKVLVFDIGIENAKIENNNYFAKVKLLNKYMNSKDIEIQRILYYIKNNSLEIFNYPFVERYRDISVEIVFDESKDLFFVWHNGRRMYMAHRYDTRDKVLKYYRSILLEQDVESPHKYLDTSFDIDEGDVVVDVGVAEGNFALEVLDRSSRIYLFEYDEEWVEALQYTFAGYSGNVIIIKKKIGEYINLETDTLDNQVEEKVNFIKMDIEGMEIKALVGAEQLIKKSNKLRCAICAYHSDHAEDEIRKFAMYNDMDISSTKGYMWYPSGDKQKYKEPLLRRGIMRLEKGCLLPKIVEM